MQRDNRERHDIPPLKQQLLERQIRGLAPREEGPRITRRRNGSLYIRREIATARELALYRCAPRLAEELGPLGVDLALEVECVFFVGDVAGDDEEAEGEPEEEGVDGEEGTVVEEDAGPPDEGGDEAETGSNGGEDEFGAVPDEDEVGVFPDVEPG
jgi:hypothetical protein